MNGRQPRALRFSRLAAGSVAVTAGLIIGGCLLCTWHTGRSHLSAAVVGAVAALVPLLIVGWLVTQVAKCCELPQVGRIFTGARLVSLRIGLALVLLQIGRMVLSLRDASLVPWFVISYLVLLAVEAVWLAQGARYLTDENRD